MKKIVLGLIALCFLVILQVACTQSTVPTGTAGAAVTPGPTSTPCAGCPLQTYQLANTWSGCCGSNQMQGAWGIVAFNQNMVVIDENWSRGQVYTTNGNFLSNFGTSGPGALNQGQGAAKSKSGILYVTDDNNNVVLKFDLQGNFLGQVNFSISVGSVTDVAVDDSGNVYTTAAGPCLAYKFSPNGTWLATYSTTCDCTLGAGGVENPTGIAVKTNGNVVLVDQNCGSGSKLVEYTNSGNFVNELDGFGPMVFSNDIEYARFDGDGNVFASDTTNSQILKADANGNLLAVFGSADLNGPEGLDIDSNGNVYVADDGNQQVAKYSRVF